MQKVLRTEIKKAIMTRYFIISIAIGILISMLGLVYNVGLFCGNQRYDGMNPCYEAFTLFIIGLVERVFHWGLLCIFLYFQSLLQFRMDGLTVENKKADI